ncbi:hypothetical protein LAZ67_22000996 [Cordylochernes scorpioides]|uniref:Reverse transcriptase Ty1/copia-type domain-containing protein n=1 Tax=Cordylochernes scorpioides TaxID=51811 RepID=A0ABY6LSL1_9ARAC|nr:hypothetical protein LAZ67_22000996 [Cordylochernes scorpioides]
MYLAIYVDDGILMGDNEEELNNILEKLSQEFEVKINNDPRTFLGINLCFEEKNKILLSRENYAKSVLERYNMHNSKPVPTPITDVAKELDKNLEISNDNKFPYRQAIGSLLYLTNKTRPDMAFATNFESRSMHDPTTQDIINIKRTLRYLNHTTNLGISYNGEMSFELNVYCDSDFAGDIKTRKSTTGYVVYLCGGPISWCSRKQPVIALSSTEAVGPDFHKNRPNNDVNIYIIYVQCLAKVLVVQMENSPPRKSREDGRRCSKHQSRGRRPVGDDTGPFQTDQPSTEGQRRGGLRNGKLELDLGLYPKARCKKAQRRMDATFQIDSVKKKQADSRIGADEVGRGRCVEKHNEFIAAAYACKEVSYIRSLLEELIPDNFDINLYVDNQNTMKMIKSGQFTTKTKHVKYHFVKDQGQKFNLIYCPTEHQIADILPKPLARPKFDKFKSLLMTTI